MDTLEQDEPVGGEGATSSQDTSAVETQTAEPVETVSDGETAEAGAPEALLAGKYKSPEELEKAYLEAQKKISEVGQKAAVADLIQEKFGIDPATLRETIERQEAERMEQAIRENPGLAAFQEVQTLKQELALRDEEKELDSFLQKNPEYAGQRDKLLKLGLNLETGKTYEEIATEYFGATRAQGQQDAYKKIDAKVRTQATGTQSAPAKKFTDADLDNMSAAELEAILPRADVSHRPY